MRRVYIFIIVLNNQSTGTTNTITKIGNISPVTNNKDPIPPGNPLVYELLSIRKITKGIKFKNFFARKTATAEIIYTKG